MSGSGLRARRAVGRSAGHHGRMDAWSRYIHERKQFGQSIGEFQLMQAKIADIYADLDGDRAPMLCAVGQRLRRSSDHARTLRGRRRRRDPVFRGEGHRMAGEAIQTLGGVGYNNDYPVGRLWRDAKLRDRRRHQRDPLYADRLRTGFGETV